ncbi:hypothetical protein GA830_10335 [Mesorhizobium sp. NBSH29]|uniref:hypothetical protein n=1 Tax=Mesorhizobium sp. NBSH29 TaxID=2654249 RepID=UPI00189688F9|nr:hypothetical protein [Mesorhizobium sp. NBSH29]QPC87093.1 hypothetical protein GA830_10335 [Mesorhizobium sp. NBSH29]
MNPDRKPARFGARQLPVAVRGLVGRSGGGMTHQLHCLEHFETPSISHGSKVTRSQSQFLGCVFQESASQNMGAVTMSKTEQARRLMHEIGDLLAPEMPAKVRYQKAFLKLVQHLPALTHRRVRSLHNGEAHRVDLEEIDAMTNLLEIEMAERERLQFVAYTNKLVALHAVGATTLTRQEVSTLAKVASRPAYISKSANSNRQGDLGLRAG